MGLITALITALSINQIDNAVELTNPAVIGFYASIVVYLYLIVNEHKKNRDWGLYWE